MKARIIGLGQPTAGDDGVGQAVLSLLRDKNIRNVELCEASSSVALFSLLETRAPVILIDAIVGAAPGEVLVLSLEELAARGARAVSSHGIGTLEVIALMRLLTPEGMSPKVQIVGVGIKPPKERRYDFSPEVFEALLGAAQAVLDLLAEF